MLHQLRRARGAGPFVLIVMLAIGLTAPSAAAQSDEPELPPFVTVTGEDGRWTTFEAPLGRVYGNASSTDGFVAVTGGSLEDVCQNNPPPLADGRFRQKRDGTWVVKTNPGGVTMSVFVYETDLDVFAFFDQQCPLFFEQDEAFAQPFARGEVVLRDKAWGLAQPFVDGPQLEGRYRNSIRGWARADDGTEYRIRAVADYEVTEDGGPPTFFREFLRVRAVCA